MKDVHVLAQAYSEVARVGVFDPPKNSLHRIVEVATPWPKYKRCVPSGTSTAVEMSPPPLKIYKKLSKTHFPKRPLP